MAAIPNILIVISFVSLDACAAIPIRTHDFLEQVVADGSTDISSGLVGPTRKLSPNLVRKAQITADGSIKIFSGLGDSTTQLSLSLPPMATKKQVSVNGSFEISDGLVDSTRMPSSSVVRKTPISADGSMNILNGLVDSMSPLSAGLVRKATEGRAQANGSMGISNGLVDSMSQLSQGLVRKATEGQITADGMLEMSNGVFNRTQNVSFNFVRNAQDGDIEIVNGLVDSTLEAPGLLRTATEGQDGANAGFELSQEVVASAPQLSPSLVRKAQIIADGSIEISSGLSDSMLSPGLPRKATIFSNGPVDFSPQLSPSVAHSEKEKERMEKKYARPQPNLVSQATDGHLTSEDSFEFSKGLVGSTPLLSPSLVRKAQDGSIEIFNGIVDPTPQVLQGLPRTAAEGKAIADGSTRISKGLVDTSLQLSPSVAHKENELDLMKGKKARPRPEAWLTTVHARGHLESGILRQQVNAPKAHAGNMQKQELLLRGTIGGHLAKKFRTSGQETRPAHRPRKIYKKQANASKNALYDKVVRQWESQGRVMAAAGTVSPSPPLQLDATGATGAPLLISTTTISPSLATHPQAVQVPVPSPKRKATNVWGSSVSYLLNLIWIFAGFLVCCLAFFLLKKLSIHVGAQRSSSGRSLSWPSGDHRANAFVRTLSPGTGGSDDTGRSLEEYDFVLQKTSMAPVPFTRPTRKSTSSSNGHPNVPNNLWEQDPEMSRRSSSPGDVVKPDSWG